MMTLMSLDPVKPLSFQYPEPLMRARIMSRALYAIGTVLCNRNVSPAWNVILKLFITYTSNMKMTVASIFATPQAVTRFPKCTMPTALAKIGSGISALSSRANATTYYLAKRRCRERRPF